MNETLLLLLLSFFFLQTNPRRQCHSLYRQRIFNRKRKTKKKKQNKSFQDVRKKAGYTHVFTYVRVKWTDGTWQRTERNYDSDLIATGKRRTTLSNRKSWFDRTTWWRRKRKNNNNNDRSTLTNPTNNLIRVLAASVVAGVRVDGFFFKAVCRFYKILPIFHGLTFGRRYLWRHSRNNANALITTTIRRSVIITFTTISAISALYNIQKPTTSFGITHDLSLKSFWSHGFGFEHQRVTKWKPFPIRITHIVFILLIEFKPNVIRNYKNK